MHATAPSLGKIRPGKQRRSEQTLEGGALLAASYAYSRRLWMTMGLLTAWNFVETGMFGVSAPGHTECGLLASRFHGVQILTGAPQTGSFDRDRTGVPRGSGAGAS